MQAARLVSRIPSVFLLLALSSGCAVPDGPDMNGDSIADDLGNGMDLDEDGDLDQVDMQPDGKLDGVGIDTDGDGFLDAVALDLNGDRLYEAMDTNGDGLADFRSSLVP